MSKLKISILAVLLTISIFLNVPDKEVKAELQHTDIVEEITLSPQDMSVLEMIDDLAPRWEQDPKLISKISYCESHHKDVPHDNGHGKGVTGIHKATFNRWHPLYQKDNGEVLNYDSTYDQIKMMSWAFSKGEHFRDDWTSYVAYTKGGEYTFFSKLLQKTFTVRCK